MRNDIPRFVILGPTGAGKSALAMELSALTDKRVVEVEDLAQTFLGTSMQVAFVEDPASAEQALLDSSSDALALSGSGADAIVVLTPTAAANEQVTKQLLFLSSLGTEVIGVNAPLDVLARRSGLLAAQPVYLGTPRAWFKDLHQSLMSSWETVTSNWYDTVRLDPGQIARKIVLESQARLDGWHK